MGYRKLISFGDASYVISLPKDWVQKNGLKKGDELLVDIHANSVNVSPIGSKSLDDNSSKEVSIEYTADNYRFKAELIYAYINNYHIINIFGNELHKHSIEIRKIVQGFAALEVVQQSSNKIVLKDMLDFSDVSAFDILRRVDRIVLSMAEDVQNALKGNMEGCFESLEQKESDVNRLTNLIFKVLRRGLEHSGGGKVGLSTEDIFYYWELALFIEKIGDQLKRIPRHLKGKVEPHIIDAYNALVEQYKLAMKANFTKSLPLALDVIANKGPIFNKLDYCTNNNPSEYIYFLEKMRIMNIYCGNIAKTLLKMGIGVKP